MLQSSEIVEASGLAASRTNPGVLWVHNDSGDSARVFAISERGENLGAYSLAGADAIDWEDMAIGPRPGPGADYLYLADIGDNAARRVDIAVYRVREPLVDRGAAPVTQELPGVERLTLRYPDKPHDAETLLVDPASGDIVIVTKEGGNSLVFRAPATATAGAETTLEQVGRINFDALTPQRRVPVATDPPLVRGGGALATGGDVTRDGAVVAIRTYGTVWVWQRAPGTALSDAFASSPCEGPSAVEPQGEALAFAADGQGYYTTSDGAGASLWRFGAP